MKFKRNHKYKPDVIQKNGVVLFTDGTNTGLPVNKVTCEAYGYTYNNGFCYAFNPSPQLMENEISETVINNGSNNTINKSGGTIVSGSNHKAEDSWGGLIAGQKHEIVSDMRSETDYDYINNAAVIGGSHGKATRAGQVVIGGGGGDSDGDAGYQQMSIYSLSAQSSGARAYTMVLQGDTDRNDEIYLEPSSINLFEINLTGLCVGGSSGTVGHYKSLVQRGTCLVSSNIEIENTYDAGTTITTASVGTTGTVSISATEHRLFRIQVTGAANVNVNWFAVVKIYSNKTKESI